MNLGVDEVPVNLGTFWPKLVPNSQVYADNQLVIVSRISRPSGYCRTYWATSRRSPRCYFFRLPGEVMILLLRRYLAWLTCFKESQLVWSITLVWSASWLCVEPADKVLPILILFLTNS